MSRSQSKEVYAKLAAGIHRNRKVRKGGRNALAVFQWVLCQVASRGATDGRIPAADVQDAEYLADELMCSEDEAADGLAQAVRVELLAIDGDMCAVVGWDDEWARRPLSGAERTAKYESKRKTDGANVRTDAPLTEPTSGLTHENATDGGEERRGEESKAVRQSAKPTAAAPKKHALRDEWQPPEELQAVARDEGVSFSREMGKLRSWAKGKGEKRTDWTEVARNWLRKAGEDRRKAKQPPQVDLPPSGALFAQARASPPQPRPDERPVNFFTSDDEDPCPDS